MQLFIKPGTVTVPRTFAPAFLSLGLEESIYLGHLFHVFRLLG
jgi:hypothetical protein